MEFAEIETLIKDNPDALAAFKSASEKLSKVPDLETKVTSLSTLQTDLEKLKAINEDLTKQKEKWKAGKSGTEAELNALMEKLAKSDEDIKALREQFTKAEDEKKTAIIEKRETDLKASIVATGSKLKGINPEDDFILLKAKGLTGHDADGKPYFHKLNDKGQPVKVDSVDEMMSWYYDKDKSRVSASGIGGVGGSHTNNGGGEPTAPTTRAEARAAFRATRLPS